MNGIDGDGTSTYREFNFAHKNLRKLFNSSIITRKLTTYKKNIKIIFPKTTISTDMERNGDIEV